MLTLFKGELSLHDILHGLPYKLLLLLRDTRIQQLEEQKKEMDRVTKEEESRKVRQSIIKRNG